MGRGRIIHLPALEDTLEFGRSFAKELRKNDVLALQGELGAGKTSFVTGLCAGLGSQEVVQSPTFTLLHQYSAELPIYHFDLYRLKSLDDFLALGFEEFFENDGICVIEWPELIFSLLPENAKRLQFEHLPGEQRVVRII